MNKKQQTFRLDNTDREAIQVIRDYYGVSSDIDAVRIALRELRRTIEERARLPKPQLRNGLSSPSLEGEGPSGR